ncbi:SGNH hydrolase-type esterase domain-containing protein [Zychaea mexicana]|uniref:SGNH hydrolase-type esterase domain-containing protein n=1 Tax=Zychaea mexicana TaxID=64656 RepID=UPI0022FDEF6D|nr:SGNH hydrolase-type esterase domain-containing protein [Zychaea mexicana]KAI9490401.1 SGNH hydrolase-type esterase domain-containing protein [Zychaea mexicana]
MFSFWLILLSWCNYLSVTTDAAPVVNDDNWDIPAFDFSTTKTLYSFGDSYTTQNLDLVSMTYACANCTSAGGRNWVEYLVDLHPMQYWNLAYNSAPVSNAMVGQNASSVIDVTTQITSMFPRHFSSFPRDPSTTLYTIWVGINDINLTADWLDTDELDRKLLEHYKSLVEYLVTQQNARQFVLIMVPPIDRSPYWLRQGPDAVNRARQRVHAYNKKLASLVKRLRSKTPGHFYLFDAWSTFTHILDHPGDYGLSDVTDYCPDWSNPIQNHCASFEQYFWYNDLHPTYRIHQYVAQDVYNYLLKQQH